MENSKNITGPFAGWRSLTGIQWRWQRRSILIMQKAVSHRRGFLKTAAGAAALGFWADRDIEAWQTAVNTNSKPSDLKITDLRVAVVARAPPVNRDRRSASRGPKRSTRSGCSTSTARRPARRARSRSCRPRRSDLPGPTSSGWPSSRRAPRSTPRSPPPTKSKPRHRPRSRCAPASRGS